MAVASRTNAQTSRPGAKRRSTSTKNLVTDIVNSILTSRENGIERRAEEYTANPTTIARVEAALASA